MFFSIHARYTVYHLYNELKFSCVKSVVVIYIYTCCFVSIEYIMWILYILYVLWRTPFLFSSLRFMCLISCFCQLETKIKSALQKSTLVCRITLFYVMRGSPQLGTSYVTNISISISYSLQLQHHHHHHCCCCQCHVISTTWPAMLPISASPFLPFSYNIIISVVVANVLWSQPHDQLCYQYSHHHVYSFLQYRHHQQQHQR